MKAQPSVKGVVGLNGIFHPDVFPPLPFYGVAMDARAALTPFAFTRGAERFGRAAHVATRPGPRAG